MVTEIVQLRMFKLSSSFGMCWETSGYMVTYEAIEVFIRKNVAHPAYMKWARISRSYEIINCAMTSFVCRVANNCNLIHSECRFRTDSRKAKRAELDESIRYFGEYVFVCPKCQNKCIVTVRFWLSRLVASFHHPSIFRRPRQTR